jgi:hypothetical protein
MLKAKYYSHVFIPQFFFQFPPERIEPLAKMSQLLLTPTNKEVSIPVKFRRNLFEDGPTGFEAPTESAADRQMVRGKNNKQQYFRGHDFCLVYATSWTS